MSTDTVLKEILKDKHYYDTSSGGVTFSGGECLLHPEYVLLCKLCKENAVSITRDCISVSWKRLSWFIRMWILFMWILSIWMMKSTVSILVVVMKGY